MRRCPYCGAQIADDSRFCSECGKEITQANVCPHCGASVGEGASFCQNCGKNLNDTTNSEPTAFEEKQPKSGLKKYLPYIIGAVVLLAIISYFNSKDSKEGNEVQTAVTETAKAEATDKEEDLRFAAEDAGANFEEDAVSFRLSGKVGGEAEIEMDGNKGWYRMAHDNAKRTLELISYNSESGKCILNAYLNGKNIGKFDGTYKGDSYIGIFESVKGVKLDFGFHNKTNVEYGSVDSEYSKYIGKWSNYIVSQGQRAKVYTAIIHNDLTAELIVYLPDGAVNTSMSFRQCVFQDGYVYFTDNGDTSIKGTPSFRLGSSGLQTADGENMVKE